MVKSRRPQPVSCTVGDQTACSSRRHDVRITNVSGATAGGVRSPPDGAGRQDGADGAGPGGEGPALAAEAPGERQETDAGQDKCREPGDVLHVFSGGRWDVGDAA